MIKCNILIGKLRKYLPSVKIDKYEYLTGEEKLLSSNQRH